MEYSFRYGKLFYKDEKGVWDLVTDKKHLEDAYRYVYGSAQFQRDYRNWMYDRGKSLYDFPYKVTTTETTTVTPDPFGDLQRAKDLFAKTMPKKDDNVSDVDQRILAKLNELRAQREMDKKLRIVASYGEDRADGAVCTFTKQFEEKGTKYTYAAIRTKGKWYLSGTRFATTALTWEEFTAFLVRGETPVDRLIWMIPESEAVIVRKNGK